MVMVVVGLCIGEILGFRPGTFAIGRFVAFGDHLSIHHMSLRTRVFDLHRAKHGTQTRGRNPVFAHGPTVEKASPEGITATCRINRM